jgi:flagellar FliL protein
MSKAQAPAATAPPAPPAEAPPEPSPKKRSPILLVAVLAVVLASFGAGGFLLVPRLLRPPGAPGAPPRKVEAPVKATFPLGSVVVNLDGTRHYAKLAVDIGVPGAKDVKEIEEHRAQLLDLVISVVSATPLEQLARSDGRAELKERLLARIHDDLGLEKVGKVYFTEFVIQ